MTSKAKYDISEMDRTPGSIYQSGNHYYQVDCWGVSHSIKKSDLARLRT